MRAPASRHSLMMSSWRGRSRITAVTSSTSSPSAFATAWRLYVTGASRSIASAASGPTAIFSMYTHGPGSNIVPPPERAITALRFGAPRVGAGVGGARGARGGPPRADLLAVVEHRRLVLLALTDDHDTVHGDVV